MDSEHNSNSCEDSDCKICQTVGSSLEESSSQMEENVQGISSNKSGSHENEPNLFQNLQSSSDRPLATKISSYQICHTVGSSLEESSSQMEENVQHISSNKSGSHENEPNLSQNLQSTSNRSLATKIGSFQDDQQTGEILNTLASSQNLCNQSSENKSNMLQDKEIPLSEIQSSGNEGAHLQPNDPPGTEFSASENKIPQCKKERSEMDNLHLLAIVASENVPSISRQLFTESQQFPDSRCYTIQETHVKTKLTELIVIQYSVHSPQQFPESNVNRIQGLDLANQQQSRNVQIMSQSSDPIFHQPHQSTVSQALCIVRHGSFGNEFRDNRVPNIEGLQNSLETSGMHDLHLSSFQKSEGMSNYIQSSQPQRLQQSESDTKAIKVYSKTNSIIDEQSSPMNMASKESKGNQDLYSQQPAETRACEDQGFHQVPQVLKISSSTERHSPYSLLQQQPKQISRAVQTEETAPSASQENMLQQNPHSRPSILFKRFLLMCVVQNMSSSEAQAPRHFNLNMLQGPYSNRSELMNLFVYGPTLWTFRLIQTYSRGQQFSFGWPYGHVLTKNVTRGGIVTTVSVYQVDNLIRSASFMRSCCLSAKTTIMLVFNVADQGVEAYIELVRRRVSMNVPITFVGCKQNVAGNKVLRLLKTGYKLKAKYDLSAFLVCKADSEEEVDAVFHNAMDVSRHVTI